MEPTAKSLVLDLLSTLRGGSMPVRALVEAAALFGIADNNLRVSLARLTATGRVARDERGRYRLSDAAAPVQGWVSGWRDTGGGVRPWRGDWLVVGCGRGRRGDSRPARALRLLGFREWRPGYWVRPENLLGGIEAARSTLWELGLDPTHPVFVASGLDPASDADVRSLWDAEALVAGYRASGAALADSRRRLESMGPAERMVETFLVGGRALRQLVLDPRLPEPIAPAGERAALVRAMRDYDRIGRTCWADFLKRHGVAHRRAPADLRLVDADRAVVSGTPGAAFPDSRIALEGILT